MPYALPDELRARIGSSMFDEIYPDSAAAAVDLASAEAEIDGVLGGRYTVPVTAERPLALLKDWTLTLAEERAGARSAGSALAEKIKLRVDQVRKYLDMILGGTFRLPGADEDADAGGASISFISSDEPLYTRDTLQGY